MRSSVVLIPLMLSALYAFLPAFGQVPLSDLEALEGPWEYTSPSGIKGIFIRAETAVINGTDTPMIDWQNVSIRVYRRPRGQSEDAQVFAPPAYNRFDQMLEGVREENYTTDLKNRRLVIHYNIDLELSFDAVAKHWAGTWSERGEQRDVLLERPHPAPESAENSVVGDWVSNPDQAAKRPPSTGSLHIRESSDGVLTAWLDHKSSHFNPRSQSTRTNVINGERFEIVTNQTQITLSTTNPFGAPYQYRGTLSANGANLAGEWLAQVSGRLSAPDNFIRAH